MYSRVTIAAERCCAGRCPMTAGQGYRVCTCFRAQLHERDLHITEALAKAALTALKSGVVASPTTFTASLRDLSQFHRVQLDSIVSHNIMFL